MGNLLKAIAISLGIRFLANAGSRAAGNIATNIDWTYEKIQRKDLGITIREGRVVGLVKIKLRILNRNAVSIYLQGYQATIMQEGVRLGSVTSLDQNIELPSGEPRTISAEFEIAGQEFIERLQSLLEGNGDGLAPIQINGRVTLSNGFSFAIPQTLEFFALT